MTITRAGAALLLDIYVRAWEAQDPKLILSIFTLDATYHERPLEAPIRSHRGIEQYWRTKVVQSQANISCRVLSVYLDGDTVVAEWEAVFDDLEKRARKRMREVAIIEVVPVEGAVGTGGFLIRSLREYWTSVVLGPALPV